ncbi:MAG: hypothetical protein APF78_05470 [Sphingomonadales bacterium BRH_c3]|nr:MAG: hypothetical protein APF78_05470 [Sphingomonadales bacterium BRH_c3]
MIAGLSAQPIYAAEDVAQENDTPSAANTGMTTSDAEDMPAQYSEIIVRARRQDERLLEVPTAITAITADELQAKGIQTTRELAIATPSLVVGSNFTSSFLSFSMRGNVPNANTSGFTDPTVQTYINEFAPIFASASALFDLSAVEVLRGPQGTLFGRSAIGGAVLYRTRQPDDEFGGFMRATIGNYNNRELEFAVNVPIINDKVALRVAGNVIRRDGYTKVLNLNNLDLDNRRSDAFRVSLIVRPSENIESLTVYDYHDVDQNSGSYSLIAVRPGSLADLLANPSNPAYQTFLAENPDLAALPRVSDGFLAYLETAKELGPRQQYLNNDPSDLIFQDRVKSISNTTTLDLGSVTLKNLVAYQTFYLAYAFNSDSSPIPVLMAATIPGEPKAFQQDYRQFSEEFQISGEAFNGQVNWQTGFYYQKNWDVRPGASVASAFLPFAFGFVRKTNTDRDLVSKALYGRADWDITDRLNFALGGRVTWDSTKTEQYVLAAAANSRGIPIGPAVCGKNTTRPFDLDDPACQGPPSDFDDKGYNWDATLSYQLSPDTMIYAASRRGYQAALVNTTASIESILVTPKSSVTDIELGVKAQGALGGSAPWQFTGAAFYQWMKDAHRSAAILDPRSNNSNGVIFPVQSATAYGIEAEFKINPVDWLDLSAFGDYVKASYRKFETPNLALDPNDPTCLDPSTRPSCNIVTTGFTDLSNNAFTYTPKYHLGASATIKIPVSDDIGTASLSANIYHEAKYFFAIDQSTEEEAIAGGQTLLNVRADVKGIFGSNVDIGAFAKNLTNDTYLVGGAGLKGSIGYIHGVYGEPRMYGVDLRVEF